jgi:hypothetical protein
MAEPGADSQQPQAYAFGDGFEVGIMNLNGCSGFALDVGEY